MTPQTVAHTWLRLDTDSHTDPVIALAAAAGGRLVVSAGECTLRVWDATTRKPLRQILGHTNPRVEGGSFDGTIDLLALTPDGRWAVTVKNARRIEVFEVATGNLVAAFEHAASPVSLAFSPDGRWLALAVTRRQGSVHRRGALQVFSTRALTTAGFDRPPAPTAERHIAQTRMVEEVMHLALTVRWIPAPLEDLPGRSRKAPRSGRPHRATGRGFGLVVAVHSLSDDRQHRLHWLQFQPELGLDVVRSAVPDRAIESATLAVTAQAVVVATTYEGHVSDPARPLGRLIALDHHGRLRGEILVEQAPVAIAVAPDGQAFAVGLAGDPQVGGLQPALTHVMALGPDGFELRSTYYGHDLEVKGLAWLDADTVLSAGGDNNAIHLWSPRTRVALLKHALRGVGQDLLDAGIDALGQVRFGTVPPRLRPLNLASRQQRFDLNTLRLHTVSPSEPDGQERENARWALGGAGRQVVQIYHRPDIEGWEVQLWRPGHLTLFVGADDRWVLWTPSGFYATNAPDKSRFGFCVDRGPLREALFLPADRFPIFDREDIVRAVVEHGSEERARAQGVAIPPVDVAALLPPVVEIDRFTVTADRRAVRVHFRVEPLRAEQPTTRVWILRNDRYAWFEADAKALRRRRWRLELRLNPGRNVFKVHAESASAKSLPCVFEVQGPAAPAADVRLEAGRGRLFLLSVGVSNFQIAGTAQAGATQPLKFPARDATAVYNALAGSRQSARFHPHMQLRNAAFESVQAALLVDRQATKAAILDRVRQFADTIVQRERDAGAERDVLFVFLSGHGTRFAGEPELYFWNWDLVNSGADMERTGLSLVEFAEIATAVPAEVVLVIDACHSGMSGNNMMRALDPEELARRILAIHERGMYVINASRSDELSWEHERLGHGVLTSALLQALRDRRSAGGAERGVSMLGIVAAVQELVPRLSARLGAAPQTPVCRLYGDLLPLTIYQAPGARRASHRLRGKSRSATVTRPPGANPSERTARMATKKAAAKKTTAKKAVAKKTPAKKAGAKKAAAKKTAVKKAPAKKAASAKKTAPAKPRKRVAGGSPKPGADVVR
jgi:uncharacterized caspase-like protein